MGADSLDEHGLNHKEREQVNETLERTAEQEEPLSEQKRFLQELFDEHVAFVGESLMSTFSGKTEDIYRRLDFLFSQMQEVDKSHVEKMDEHVRDWHGETKKREDVVIGGLIGVVVFLLFLLLKIFFKV